LLLFVVRSRITSLLERKVPWVLAARSLLRVTLDIALLFVGMRLLYVEDATAAFGGGFSSVIGFLVWGFASDLTAQAIANLKK
jgi:hypothetical protein